MGAVRRRLAGHGVITADDLARRLTALEPIGLDERGTTRLAWTPEDEAAGEWFAGHAEEVGLQVQIDPAGNRWAVPDAPLPWWGVGSHLDSVRSGGRYDGALGVCAGFALAEHAPVAVIAFADEEGARFNTPTFGSRALTGALDPTVLERRDDDGVRLADAMTAVGVDPGGIARAPQWLRRLRGFLELHVDQTPDLRRFAVARGLAARVRMQADLVGRADHAGTTRRHERSDALLAAARLIVTADELAGEDMVMTASRIIVEPNAMTTVASHVRVWLDARSELPSALDEWLGRLDAWLGRLDESRAGPADAPLPGRAELTVASRSDGVTFDPELRAALGDPEGVVCFAGHDAGILAERMPAAMVLTRNPTGISHSPEEAADLDDAAAAANAILEVVR
jgi:beta-ureidopropionase / N-carbamoyl-L-amino-acid hydrolase